MKTIKFLKVFTDNLKCILNTSNAHRDDSLDPQLTESDPIIILFFSLDSVLNRDGHGCATIDASSALRGKLTSIVAHSWTSLVLTSILEQTGIYKNLCIIHMSSTIILWKDPLSFLYRFFKVNHKKHLAVGRRRPYSPPLPTVSFYPWCRQNLT